MTSPATAIEVNSVGWYILEGYPWWPVYICDQTKLRAKLHQLGDGHRYILRKARDFPEDYALVYYFGSHDFSLVGLKKGVLRPWECSDKATFLKGHPKHLVKKKNTLEELKMAIQEAEDYLSQPEEMRLPPHMVPSDLDPTLEPPPEIDRSAVEAAAEEEEEEDDDKEEEEDAEMASADENDEEGEEKEEETNTDAEQDGGSDQESKKKSKKKEKKKSSSTKKTKKTKEKDDKKKKSKKSSSKKKEMDGTKKPKRRLSQAPDDTTDQDSQEPPEKRMKQENEATPTSSSPKDSEASTATSLTGDALSAKLEEEIRWILVNCQFEEMTTKTVRTLLEKRLNMDLRHQKQAIKAGVARVIESMEEEEVNEAKQEEEKPAEPVKQEEEPVKEEVKGPAKEEPSEAPTPARAPSSPSPPQEEVKQEPETEKKPDIAKQLDDVEKELSLALGEDRKIQDALEKLANSMPSIARDQLEAATQLLPRLIKCRAHRNEAIASLMTRIAKQWDVEDLIPAPEPIKEADLIQMKEKLEDSATSHDELLACLKELADLPLQISHLKSTGISRAVANLRQHANDKVSITAKNLRNSWMQLVKKGESSDKHSDRSKKLESMYRILEQQKPETDDQKLSILEKLYKMPLTTQEIIESKIGLVISKLRKSSHEPIARAAAKLRKKWRNEASA